MEIDIFFAIDRNEMDVGVRNFEAQHNDRYPFAGYFLLYFAGDPFGEDDHTFQRPVVEIKNIIGFLFGYDQRMTLGQRVDVEEGIITVVLGYLVAGDFSSNDFRENSGHGSMFGWMIAPGAPGRRRPRNGFVI